MLGIALPDQGADGLLGTLVGLRNRIEPAGGLLVVDGKGAPEIGQDHLSCSIGELARESAESVEFRNGKRRGHVR
jgi:hypothetical protein